jgi:hypothetical protein
MVLAVIKYFCIEVPVICEVHDDAKAIDVLIKESFFISHYVLVLN